VLLFLTDTHTCSLIGYQPAQPNRLQVYRSVGLVIMAEAIVLKSDVRTGSGGRDSARLRKSGRIPAVVYGHKQTPDHIHVSKDELDTVIRHRVRNLELEVKGKKEPVLIQAVQHDYLGRDVLHVDFRRVSADERIHANVHVHLRGTAKGAMSGGVLDQPLHVLHIDCLASAVPESIVVKIDDLQVGQAIHVKELVLPPGVKVLGDPDAVVVQIKLPSAEPVPTAIPVEGAVEPEVITAKKPKEEEEE
jgi:large subunit ribosomal protein L25